MWHALLENAKEAEHVEAERGEEVGEWESIAWCDGGVNERYALNGRVCLIGPLTM